MFKKLLIANRSEDAESHIGHGNTIHLFERDCSIQRHNQKLIEIAPSPQLNEAQRQHIGALAVRAAQAVVYENAGTPELITEAMTMETEIQAPVGGRVTALHVKKGDRVTPGEILLEIS